MKRCAFALLVAALWPAAAAAGTICRWTDADGRTQLADTVPEKYRARATCTDTAEHELTAAQKAEAARRAAARPVPAAAPAPAASAASAAATLGRDRKPVLDDRTDCRTWRRAYEESQACFAPFRTVTGAVKAEAFGRCEVVPAPPQRCPPEVR